MKKIPILFLVLLIGIALYAFVPRPYTFNTDKVKTYITQHAASRSRGLCALYVRKALEAGGCCMWGYPNAAKKYREFLPYLDFTEIDKENYHPEIGDIVVFNSTEGHPYGHIAIWNGQQWVSDFRQRSLYVANAYRKSKDFQYFRMTKQHPKRHFTFSHHSTAIGEQPLIFIVKKIQEIF